MKEPTKVGIVIVIGCIAVLLVNLSHTKSTEPQITQIISGSDTVVIIGRYNIDVSKARATSGHNDTINHVFRLQILQK